MSLAVVEEPRIRHTLPGCVRMYCQDMRERASARYGMLWIAIVTCVDTDTVKRET
jgi:hypothetical protein